MTRSRTEPDSPQCGDVARSRGPNPRNVPDRGSATVVWLAYMAVIVMVGAVGLAIGELSAGRAQAASAADLGALAAADRALRGDQCGAAQRVVRANDARLRGCTISDGEGWVVAGSTVTVEVEVRTRGLLAALAKAAGQSPPTIRSSARAGQPIATSP